jgi:hypothetical protein
MYDLNRYVELKVKDEALNIREFFFKTAQELYVVKNQKAKALFLTIPDAVRKKLEDHVAKAYEELMACGKMIESIFWGKDETERVPDKPRQ